MDTLHEPIDRTTLVARCLNDPEFVRQLLDLFVTTAPDQAQRLKDALARSDLREATRMAHTLKGSAANLSAEGLRQVAGEIERLLRAEQTAEASELVPLLDRQVKRCVQFAPALAQNV